MSIHDEVDAERERAHIKHGDTSMRSLAWWAHRRHTILAEECGEVATAFNDNDHHKLLGDEFKAELRKELIQVAAMAVDWVEAIDADEPPHPDTIPSLNLHGRSMTVRVLDANGLASWINIVP